MILMVFPWCLCFIIWWRRCLPTLQPASIYNCESDQRVWVDYMVKPMSRLAARVLKWISLVPGPAASLFAHVQFQWYCSRFWVWRDLICTKYTECVWCVDLMKLVKILSMGSVYGILGLGECALNVGLWISLVLAWPGPCPDTRIVL